MLSEDIKRIVVIETSKENEGLMGVWEVTGQQTNTDSGSVRLNCRRVGVPETEKN